MSCELGQGYNSRVWLSLVPCQCELWPVWISKQCDQWDCNTQQHPPVPNGGDRCYISSVHLISEIAGLSSIPLFPMVVPGAPPGGMACSLLGKLQACPCILPDPCTLGCVLDLLPVSARHIVSISQHLGQIWPLIGLDWHKIGQIWGLLRSVYY